MKGWFPTLALSTLLASGVFANEVEIKQDNDHRQKCAGMYSRKAWGGDVEPFILTKFNKIEEDVTEDFLVSLVVFEWGDEDLIGRVPAGSDERATICDQANVEAKLCSQDELGAFILAENAKENSKNPILSQAVNLKDPAAINYPIKNTGFYCVSTFAYSGHEYEGVIEFRNAYGELPGAQIAKLPFYGGLTLVYALIGAFWAFLYVQNRHDILPVQNYITAILIFLIVEEAMTWIFYDYQNRHGSNAGAKVMMILVAILNAGRNSFSFFLLLIVCMGYGVVKPTLGRTMVWVRILAITHFVFGVIYSIASLSIAPDSAGPLVLLVILPLAATLTAFYVWTLNSLNSTMKDLIDRRQKTKAMMYKKLWWCILASIIVIFGFFFLNSFAFAGQNAANFVPDHWKTRWFVLDGWLNIVYLFDIAFIAYLWRPTANNRRFAMSDEIAQDDDGFEIRSLANSLDEEDAVGIDDDEFEHPRHERELSPVPPKPVQPAPQQRESLDGETIFAVGEEDGDKFSDDEDDSFPKTIGFVN
ncbi:Membrane protein PTM1 [Talaromyces islandicus]|uniref:Membrane protein PTM1 n=1 Tax=Talaromyces islandicus TaxID=28573 RepID=A0A0U1M6S9_TALIS|nr:Membrane protein PTM1 [Talaromyces islandicus]